ncbi:hypothetical protein [Aequorivita antarctica]|uniref:Uncharacterized protein n=1 Tax=Aequorivita antarctica TaxID=153266 RepID=A0A5C6YYN1_9FLAO|nr:hypothetical protein [Aequorivita antarctica]TXD72719.1 hypothetical protein ESU54_10885 [Aequorivita antarctica]SRX74757.1 hypothetical protein AEQU3_01737 [Aequorivita antarctica]
MNNLTDNCYICQFNKENLKRVLKNDFITLDDIEKKKRHFLYLLEYLGSGDKSSSPGLNAGMILVEEKYTSRSYLEDYRDHYFMSYSSYKRHCQRIHFFQHKVSANIQNNKEEQIKFFELLLSKNKDSEAIWKGYLGHIVKRPIPNGIIGATLLKTYQTKKPVNGYFRKYTVRKNYKVNLFGHEEIIKTLIYVEQDRIVGACATSALYVAFHRLSHLFETSRPNQKKISDAAGISVRTPNRKLKNKEGLTPFQICRVIETFGLDPEIYSLKKLSSEEIKAMLYAYLKMGIPVILGFQFDPEGKKKKNSKEENHHAITLTGYSETLEENTKYESYKNKSWWESATKSKQKLPLNLKSKYIQQFYAHDDQIGPFARIRFDSEDNKLTTSWWDSEKGIKTKLLATPFVSIMPLSDRIRLPYEATRENVEIINVWLDLIIDGLDYINWDIYLSRSNKEKKYILESKDYQHNLHADALSETYPKYVWVADCYLANSKLFKIMFDASDINYKHFGWDIVYFNTDFKSLLENYFKDAMKTSNDVKNNEYLMDVIKTTGIETTNLFRKSLKFDPIEI